MEMFMHRGSDALCRERRVFMVLLVDSDALVAVGSLASLSEMRQQLREIEREPFSISY